MISNEVTLILAFGAGFLSFFSPCILPMIPAYIMYITGTNTEEEIEKKRFLALVKTFGFIIGFTIIFVTMGSSASFLGKTFIRNKELFSKISGIVIAVFGLNMIGIINLKYLSIERRVSIPKKMNNWFSPILMGMAFAAGWTPCFSPVLGSILFYAGSATTISKGIYLLFVYSIGMAIPFILTALFINIFNKFLIRTEGILKYISKISGIIIFIFGVLIFLNKVVNISRWLVQ